ncbi:RNA binding motif protein 12Ba [Vanacampus margaritifer]
MGKEAASVVRLKGLDPKASAEDIRGFFPGLRIPKCGVCILGGPQHEAFVAFESESEAQSAVGFSGHFLKGRKVTIRLSSISETEHKLQYFWKKQHSPSESQPRGEKGALEPPVVNPQLSPPRDPRTVSASSSTNSPPPVPSGDLRTFDKPRGRKMDSPSDPRQTCEKPRDPRTTAMLSGCPQMRNKPCYPRTIAAPSGSPQIRDKLPELNISSSIVSSDFLQTSDKSHCPPKYKPLVPGLCSPTCDKPLNYTTFSTPDQRLQNSDQSQTSDPLKNAFLLGVCTVLESLQSYQSEQREILPERNRQEGSSTIMPETRTPLPGYVRLFGLPGSTTKADISSFFEVLMVDEVIINMKLEHHHVCLVKFVSEQDAVDALQFNNRYLGPVCVEVRKGTEMMWNLALQECENACRVTGVRNSPTDTANRKHELTSEQKCSPAKKARLHSPGKEYIVKVCHLPVTTTKTIIKKVFGCHDIESSKIQHLLDKNRERTDTAFLIFNRKTDYEHAMSRNGWRVGSCAIKVSGISSDEMMEMVRSCNSRSEELIARTKTCLVVENMPEHMKESLIQKLSHKYKVATEDVVVLSDDGKASCTVMVPFKSLKFVTMAHELSQDLLGENAIITRINHNEMNTLANEGLH